MRATAEPFAGGRLNASAMRARLSSRDYRQRPLRREVRHRHEARKGRAPARARTRQAGLQVLQPFRHALLMFAATARLQRITRAAGHGSGLDGQWLVHKAVYSLDTRHDLFFTRWAEAEGEIKGNQPGEGKDRQNTHMQPAWHQRTKTKPAQALQTAQEAESAAARAARAARWRWRERCADVAGAEQRLPRKKAAERRLRAARGLSFLSLL